MAQGPEADLTFSKYEEERQKRIRDDGLAQYVKLTEGDDHLHLADDPFGGEFGDRQWSIPFGVSTGKTKVVIIGAGYGGLTYAVRLIQGAGFTPEDIVFLDTASGFGGAWYWNRYPGLMCDVESACYMPLLEETGYIPKNKYSYGSELRGYAELLASTFKLTDRGLWKVTVKSASWDDAKASWTVDMLKTTKDGQKQSITLETEYLVMTAGPLTNPKLPRIPGAQEFGGTTFHTARWDYNTTGGTAEDPTLSKLHDKRVAFIGTGATCIQAAPHLGKWAKELYIYQRTPSAVAVRGQQDVDPDRFRAEVSSKKGWQKRRRENMAMFVEGNTPDENLVQDGWTTFPSYAALVGGPAADGLTDETLPQYIDKFHKLDYPRQEGIRARVKQTVKNTEVAASLTPWYPGWCKRPCFHDQYLDTFNRTNVTLVDTRGRGVEAITKTGVVFDGKEYPADILIYGTGFEPLTAGGPSLRAGMEIYGRNGIEMETKWSNGLATLYGLVTHDFPNLFLSGVYQMGSTVNYAHMVDVMATSMARVISRAREKHASGQDGGSYRMVIEPSPAGEEAWAQRVLSTARGFGAMAGCTPSYGNGEGRKAKSKEEELNVARSGNWGKGCLDYAAIVEKWASTEDLEGLEFRVVSA
ncbi:hypothetical protein CkaCkLH20_12747 [Colletotrichum karsti]|uniref:Uncharacterized protein n=1 Tax=Colletotrichum karsti TaxID=1095194 RepID=A0A9P6HT64_9PEZI|nr:uncharacterized protein CkaCkLH20_12747 [Colletotrichum karsti]KAF9869704.1 hypothetical protein CkaCkLH20_12747 [Colletotrichum karsti]